MHYDKLGDFKLALQLGFWVAMTSCNFIATRCIFTTWVLPKELQELQQTQLIVCMQLMQLNWNSIETMHE
jgi:hypothetical protein